MTRQEALWIIGDQKKGLPVRATELQTALALMARTRDKRISLPLLTEAAKAKANLSLIWNLWQASARAQ